MNRMSRIALRVSPRRSLEILMFFAEKIVAHTSWAQEADLCSS